MSLFVKNLKVKIIVPTDGRILHGFSSTLRLFEIKNKADCYVPTKLGYYDDS